MRKKKQDYVKVPNHTMSREELEIANMAADLKIAFKAKWLGVYKRPYKKVDRADSSAVWEAAAKQVIAMRGTAGSYIEAQFSMAKSVPLPNRLAGPKAMQRYKSYLIACGINDPVIKSTLVDSDGRIDPGKAEVKELLAAHVAYMKNTYGIEDLGSKAHFDIVTTSPWLFNPVAACVLLYPNKEAIKVLREGALAILDEYPYLQRALKELGYSDHLTAILIE